MVASGFTQEVTFRLRAEEARRPAPWRQGQARQTSTSPQKGILLLSVGTLVCVTLKILLEQWLSNCAPRILSVLGVHHLQGLAWTYLNWKDLLWLCKLLLKFLFTQKVLPRKSLKTTTVLQHDFYVLRHGTCAHLLYAYVLLYLTNPP